MIDKELQKEMLLYYNERAKEYDEVYRGEGPAIQQYSDVYKKDVAEISKMASGFGNGHLIDIACGTGFWAPHYAGNCSRITFLDQSEGVLTECRNRVDSLGLAVPRQYIRGNLFDIELEASAYDCALVGFLLSHFTEEQEETYEIIKKHGDMICFHLDGGVPWVEAFEGKPYAPAVEEKIQQMELDDLMNN